MGKVRSIFAVFAWVAGSLAAGVVAAPPPAMATQAASTTGVTETFPNTLVVDKDKAQCPDADFASIQGAVTAAEPGDVIRVCPDLYPESVTVDKSLTLTGDVGAASAVDCFDTVRPQLSGADPTVQAIIDSPSDAASSSLKLAADNIVIEGFVIQGSWLGIDATEGFSGYTIRHNLVQLNNLFGIDFGSQGSLPSRVHNNCIRWNQRGGLVTELVNDDIWSENLGARGLDNARDLAGARIDHNSGFMNREAIVVAGPGERSNVMIDHNTVRDLVGIGISNSTGSAILFNEAEGRTEGNLNSSVILVGGANRGLEIANNTAVRGLQGMPFALNAYIDRFPVGCTPGGPLLPCEPNVRLNVHNNDVSDNRLDGMVLGPFASQNGTFVRNTFNANVLDRTRNIDVRLERAGFNIRAGNTGNVVENNVANGNGGSGIYANAGATVNTFLTNEMLGNAQAAVDNDGDPRNARDARDGNNPTNLWLENECVTDLPAGQICAD